MADRTEVYRRNRKIIFSVTGTHTTEAAEEATKYVLVLVEEIQGPVEFVADLRHITGFTSEGRRFWQDAFKKAQGRIKLITLVQGSSLARMTASAVGLYAGLKVRSVDTLEEALDPRADPPLKA